MSVYAQFLKLRGPVYIWCWPLLLFELWCLSAWAEEEARARGADLQLLIAADKWGRVHLLFLSDRAEQASGLERLSPFLLPGHLALDAAWTADACGAESSVMARIATGHGAAWLSQPAMVPAPVAPDTS